MQLPQHWMNSIGPRLSYQNTTADYRIRDSSRWRFGHFRRFSVYSLGSARRGSQGAQCITRPLPPGPGREYAVVLAVKHARVPTVAASSVRRRASGGGVDGGREIGDLLVHRLNPPGLQQSGRGCHEHGTADLCCARVVNLLLDSARRAIAADVGRGARY